MLAPHCVRIVGRLLPTLLPALVGFLIIAGCSRPGEKPTASAKAGTEATVEDDAPDETEVALTQKLEERKRATAGKPKKAAFVPVSKVKPPGAGEQACFECEGHGVVACPTRGCSKGYLPCPGPCLKRHEGTWVPDPKHGGMARAIKVPDRRTYYIPEYHAGEVWVYEGGNLVSKGNCPTCGGRRTIDCKTCSGMGTIECEVCAGKGVVPSDWKPHDNPWFNRQPDIVRLKDGRIFLAVEAGGDDAVVMWKTHRGEIISVARDEVSQWPKKL